MPQELFLLKQLLGGGEGWLQAAYVLGLFAILVYRPERIRIPGLFSFGCIVFALSVAVPPALAGLLGLLAGGWNALGSSRGSSSSGWVHVAPLLSAAGPVLLGISLVCVLIAICPAPVVSSRLQPPRHPLQ
jgi:hypothetical protein